MLTRRVRGRTFLLRPDKRTNQLVGYVLAVMAKKWRIRLIAVDVLSNHWHVVLADDHGTIVDSQRDCHSFIARALNAGHGEFEAVWSSDPPSRVSAEEPDDLVSQIAYTMANPVEAGLVMYGSSWPGLRAAWPAKPKTFKRPSYFFRGEEKGGSWPKSATLELCRPDGYDELSDEELAGIVESAIFKREERFRRQFKRAGRPFLGRREVLRQSRHARATSRETRFGISPRVACKNKWRRIERLRANQDWQQAYEVARAKFVAGDRDAEFPYGTYQMCVQWGARCAAPPD
jgi:putative transposase